MGGASHDCLSGHVLDNQRSCERKGSIYEIPHDSCGRGRSSGLVAVRLRPRVAALRHRGRLLSRSRRGGGPLRSRRRVCSPSKPTWRPSVQQRRVWRSYPRRPQGMLPVLLKHFPHRTLVQPRWTPGRRKKMRPVLLGGLKPVGSRKARPDGRNPPVPVAGWGVTAAPPTRPTRCGARPTPAISRSNLFPLHQLRFLTRSDKKGDQFLCKLGTQNKSRVYGGRRASNQEFQVLNDQLRLSRHGHQIWG